MCWRRRLGGSRCVRRLVRIDAGADLGGGRRRRLRRRAAPARGQRAADAARSLSREPEDAARRLSCRRSPMRTGTKSTAPRARWWWSGPGDSAGSISRSQARGTSRGGKARRRPAPAARAAGQLMVCDGKNLWFLDRDLQQVTVKPVDAALSATPAMLLSGTVDVRRQLQDHARRRAHEDSTGCWSSRAGHDRQTSATRCSASIAGSSSA